MDVESLITDSKARFNHNSAKAILREKYENKLQVADQLGLWKADKETIGFLAAIDSQEIVMLDTFGNPVRVDRLVLLNKLVETYHTVMNTWYNEWKEIETKR